MERIVVVGPSGAGKTTVAAALAPKLGYRHVEMDGLWWGPNWTEVGPELLREALAPMVQNDRWVVDGNYFTVGSRDIGWPRADTIVWLDPPRWLTMSRIVRRSVRRATTRTELWSGNRERLWRALHRDELIRFAWREFPKYRNRYRTIATDPTYAHLTVIRLESQRRVRGWLASVG